MGDSFNVPAVHPDVVRTVLADVADHTHSQWRAAWLVHIRALRARSDAARNVLAAGAMADATWQDVAERVWSLTDTDIESMDPKSAGWWRGLGRVTVLHSKSEDETRLGAAFYDTAVRLNPKSKFRRLHYVTYVQALGDIGQWHRIRDVPIHDDELSALESAMLELDIIAATHGADSAEWIAHLNRELMATSGLAPVELLPEGRTLFDRLGTAEAPPSVDGPLITVVMTTYRRHDEILTAVNSILRQTWRNLELLVVDDCSGPEFAPLLEDIGGLDQRIRIITQDVNSGAYVGRNRALLEARGAFITFQDDDDWSHPERLARQVAPMLADTSVHSTLSRNMRVNERMEVRNLARNVATLNSSSLMFRASDLSRLGGFDTVRKAADSEFIRRLQLAVQGRQVVMEEVLAFVRLTAGSLSRTEFSPGWRHPARGEYWESSDRWFREIERTGAACIDTSGVTRSFPAPRRFLGGSALELKEREFDVVIAADWCSTTILCTRAWGLLLAAVSLDLKVGIVSLDLHTGTDRGVKKTAVEVRELIHRGVIDHILPTDHVQIESLIVDGPHLLEFVDREPWLCDVERAVVVVDDAPAEASRSSLWSVGDVRAAMSSLFSVSPTWRTTSASSHEVLESIGVDTQGVDIAPFVMEGPSTVADRALTSVPVIGRWSSGRRGEWPAAEADFAFAYPSSSSFDVRILGRDLRVDHDIRRHSANWVRYGVREIALLPFLQQLDFYVYFSEKPPSRDEIGAILAAAQAGRVAILDPALEPLFGAVALYVAPQDVQNEIRALHQDRSAYDHQVEVSRRALTEEFGRDAGARAIESLLSAP